MAPPPTPASLADLPGPWLLKLAGSDSFEGQDETLWSLSRTCSLFRDLVLRQRKATATFNVPITPQDFPRELRRLCTLARSSPNIRLGLEDPRDNPFARWTDAIWTETEPHVAHLLLCAMAQLGGQPLVGVKEIKFQYLEHTSLVPMWLPLVCPNVTTLFCSTSTITEHLPLPAPPTTQRPATTSPALPPVACQHLQDFKLTVRGGTLSAPQAQHLRQQLAALPSLASLTLWDSTNMAAELHSTSTTRLSLEWDEGDRWPAALQRLPAQSPNLVELRTPSRCALDDAGLEAMLRMRSLRRVQVGEVHLERSHAHRACTWEQLSLWTLDVDQVARLPLEGILQVHALSVHPSRDAQAVTRVATAVKRWRGLGAEIFGGFHIDSKDPAALLTTLRPLVEALPAEQQHDISIAMGSAALTPGVLQQLGQQLPPAVHTLRLSGWSWAREAWAAVLPSLPATVTRLELAWWSAPPQEEDHLLALCAGAVRPITVAVRDLRDEDQQHIRTKLAQQGNTHVTLLFE